MRDQDFFRWLPEYKYDAYAWEFNREEKISRYQLGFVFMNVFSKYVQDHGLGKSSYLIQASNNVLNEG